ncbi:hypothetical protein Pla175_50220 [Pirellulimonas nuda]|uniref:Uncharacterized protein n=1 Tax=Pirellulimonas nuda TaxID=2528009 RepID=A0A518DJH7_9BACT|nr:DUF6580 family putative transport protein [Pirellulimonas nuda]QDU91592.1 hypothetical protein Pla175_50220 [Pirellulimonas nuda]
MPRTVLSNKLVSDALVFVLLVAIGVVGRLVQPDWNFNPIAAVAVFAGFWFGAPAAAMAVPMVAMALSNALLPGYDNLWVMLSVYAALLLPPAIGRLVRAAKTTPTRVAALATGCVAPAVLFFLVTNAAVWAFQSDYPKDAAGLGASYAAGLPFLARSMAADTMYTGLLFGSAALAGCFSLRSTARA